MNIIHSALAACQSDYNHTYSMNWFSDLYQRVTELNDWNQKVEDALDTIKDIKRDMD